MKRTFCNIAMCCLCGVFSVQAFAQDLVLTVDLQANTFSLSNEDAVVNVVFDAYRIQSSFGVMDPGAWSSLEDQFIGSWDEAGTPSETSLAETRREGLEILTSGVNINLGTPYNPGPATVNAGFGADILGDLSIESFDSSTGALSPGRVVYVGEPEFNNLVINVNRDTGNITLENESPSAVEIEAYGIFSDAGSLDTGWNGLRDTETDWNEIGSVSSFQLGETTPAGALQIASGATYDLGSAFSVGGVEDLTFDFLIAGTFSGFDGEIKYLSAGGVDGDFNGDGLFDCMDVNALTTDIASGNNTASFDLTGDGFVNGDDLDQWLADAGAENNASGGAYLVGDANLDGSVDVSDFNVWNTNKFTANSNWCEGDFNADGSVDVSDFNLWNTNKFNSSDVQSVPEPTSVLAMLLAFGGLLGFGRRVR